MTPLSAHFIRALCLAAAFLALLDSALPRQLKHSTYTLTKSTKHYSAADSGGLSLISNYTLTRQRDRSIIGSQLNTSYPGYHLHLLPQELLLSAVYTGASCFQVSMNPSGPGAGGFISTYADAIATTTGNGQFRTRSAVVLDGTNISIGDVSTHRGAADPSEEYVFAVYNLDERPADSNLLITAQTAAGCNGALASPPVSLTPFLASSPPAANGPAFTPLSSPSPLSSSSPTPSSRSYPEGRKLQQAAARDGAAYAEFSASTSSSVHWKPHLTLSEQYAMGKSLSPSLAPSLSTTESVIINHQGIMLNSQLVWLGAFTNASCIAYKLLGQPTNSRGQVPGLTDLSVFVLDEADTISWAEQDFGFEASYLTFKGIALQNNNNLGNMDSYLDSLETNQTYMLWAAAGMQQPDIKSSIARLDIGFTAQSTGSCANNGVRNWNSRASLGFGQASSPSISKTARAAMSGAPSPTAANSQATPGAPKPFPTAPPFSPPDTGPSATAASTGLFGLPGKRLR